MGSTRSTAGMLAGAPTRDKAREHLVDGHVHRIGVAAACLAAIWVIAVAWRSDNSALTLSLLIYAIGLLAMLGCSAAYNLAKDSPRRELLRRFDHAAIFLMIAGTYTPFTVVGLNGAWSVAMTTAIWACAAAGMAAKLFR